VICLQEKGQKGNHALHAKAAAQGGSGATRFSLSVLGSGRASTTSVQSSPPHHIQRRPAGTVPLVQALVEGGAAKQRPRVQGYALEPKRYRPASPLNAVSEQWNERWSRVMRA